MCSLPSAAAGQWPDLEGCRGWGDTQLYESSSDLYDQEHQTMAGENAIL